MHMRSTVLPSPPRCAPLLFPLRYYDNLHTSGNKHGRAFRDLEWEERIKKMTQQMGIGAQFGGANDCWLVPAPILRALSAPQCSSRPYLCNTCLCPQASTFATTCV
jgi:hypothetical protein